MTGAVEVHTGAIVALDDGDVYVVVKFRSAEMVLVEHRTTFKRKSVHLSDLRAVQPKDDDSKDVPPEKVTDEGWDAAREKANAVEGARLSLDRWPRNAKSILQHSIAGSRVFLSRDASWICTVSLATTLEKPGWGSELRH